MAFDPTYDNSPITRVALTDASGQPTSSSGGSSASPSIAGAEYSLVPPTETNGGTDALQIDVNGNLKVTNATLLAGEDLVNNRQIVEQRFSYTQIAAGQATTIVKTGAGFLHAIVFNSAATATNVTTVYDNSAASGTVIAIPAATTATIVASVIYDVSFATGLTILTATANGSNMTIVWR